MRPRRAAAVPAKPIPAYGILIGRMIFIGGLVLALASLAFLVMLGLAGGSWVAGLVCGTGLVAGLVIGGLAVRDLTGPAMEQPAQIVSRLKHAQGGNPNYELKFDIVNPGLKQSARQISYNVTQQDWERFGVGDRVLLRYSVNYKLLIDIRLLSRGS